MQASILAAAVLLALAACSARSGPPMGANCYHPQGPLAPPVCS